MAKFVCSICGYVHEDLTAPENCPVCKAPSSKFINGEDSISEDVRQSNSEDICLDIDEGDREIIKIIKKEGFDKAVEWYKERNYCSIEEAEEIVALIKEKIDTINNIQKQGEKANSRKKQKKGKTNNHVLMLVIGLLAAVILIGGLLSINSNQLGGSGENAVSDSIISVDSVEMDIKSPEYLKAYLEDLLNKAIKTPEERTVEKYFTKDFVRLYKEIEDYDNKNLEPGTLGFWNFDFWTGGQDGDLESICVLKIPQINNNSATAVVQFLIKFGDYDESKVSKEFKLLYESDEWRIDDFDNYKWRFKDYLETPVTEDVAVQDTVAADTVY